MASTLDKESEDEILAIKMSWYSTRNRLKKKAEEKDSKGKTLH